jgi:bifunctional non-homologous end joining protein LigD
VRLYTRRGYNWSGRYRLIIEAARRLKVRSAIIDGEADFLRGSIRVLQHIQPRKLT